MARSVRELSRRALLVSTSLSACGNDISHTTTGRVVLSRRPLSGGKEAVSGSPRRVVPHVTGAAVRLLPSSEPRKEAYHRLCERLDACWTCITACGAWHQLQEQRWRGDCTPRSMMAVGSPRSHRRSLVAIADPSGMVVRCAHVHPASDPIMTPNKRVHRTVARGRALLLYCRLRQFQTFQSNRPHMYARSSHRLIQKNSIILR